MALILYCGSGDGHFLCAQLHRKTQFVLFQGAKSCFGNRSSGLALEKYCFHIISNAQLHLALGPCANAWCACCLHCVKWERKQKLPWPVPEWAVRSGEGVVFSRGSRGQSGGVVDTLSGSALKPGGQDYSLRPSLCFRLQVHCSGTLDGAVTAA